MPTGHSLNACRIAVGTLLIDLLMGRPRCGATIGPPVANSTARYGFDRGSPRAYKGTACGNQSKGSNDAEHVDLGPRFRVVLPPVARVGAGPKQYHWRRSRRIG